MHGWCLGEQKEQSLEYQDQSDSNQLSRTEKSIIIIQTSKSS
jgi:hypothetical protein